MAAHLHLHGGRRADRLRVAAELGEHTAVAMCHRNRCGPYSGLETILRAVLPDASARWPELVEAHRVELLYGTPDLTGVIGPAPHTLTSAGPFQQRTRFYGAQMIRCMSHGVVTFLLAYARRRVEAGGRGLSLVFEDLHAADPTMRELVALLARRAAPALVRVVAGSTGPLPAELTAALARHAEAVAVPESPAEPDRRTAAELAWAWVRSDGCGDDPAELSAYRAADPGTVATLHDRRAAELAPAADWGTRLGALAFHREHGSDPRGAGHDAIDEAFQFCVEAGFSAAVIDFGTRLRRLIDPDARPDHFCTTTMHVASALVGIGQPEAALELYQELRRRFTLPKVHAIASYGIAMLYTRFFTPRDHEAALAWQNTAVTIAGLLPDPDDRRTHEVFHANGLALVEMHRRNLPHALELVETGIARLNAEIPDDQWLLHRSQLLYNRARLLAALGRLDEAHADFTTLVDLDPYYTDYLSERASLSRKRGDLEAALADYDRAVALAPPFPELYYNRGTARADLGDIDGALSDFGYVLEMEPDDIETRLRHVELLMAEERWPEAEAAVLDGLAHQPGQPRLLTMRGLIALERDAPDEALAYLDAALAVEPDDPAALTNRAVANYRRDAPHAAVADLTAAINVVGPDPDLLLNRGIALAAAGEPERALADVTAALALPDADLAELTYWRDRCLAELGRQDEAAKEIMSGRR